MPGSGVASPCPLQADPSRVFGSNHAYLSLGRNIGLGQMPLGAELTARFLLRLYGARSQVLNRPYNELWRKQFTK